MKKIYFFAFILLNLLNSCSSDNSEENKLSAIINLSATKVNVGDEIKVTNLSTSSAGIASYLFTFGNDATSTEKEPTFYYSRPGQYGIRLTITDVNGATASTTLTVTVTEENSLYVENQNPEYSDTYPLEIGIANNKIYYTEAIRSVMASNSSFYRHVEYDEASKALTSKLIGERTVNSGHAHTTFLNNGNKIVTFVETLNYIGSREIELNADWGLVKNNSYSKITYGSLQNNNEYYFYGAYDNNPSIEIRNSTGQFVSRKTYESAIKNAFIGSLIKTGNTYVAFGGKFDPSTTDPFINYRPILLFLNENLEITSQKIFDISSYTELGKSWNNLNGSFTVRKLTNGNLAFYSHSDLRVTTAQGEELKKITFENSAKMQALIEVENGFIVSSSQKLEKYDNSGKLIKSISYIGSAVSGFVKKGDLIYFVAATGSSYGDYSVNKTILGAIDSNLSFKKI